MIRPGEIYMADFGPAGPHPVIVTSREILNRGRYALAVNDHWKTRFSGYAVFWTVADEFPEVILCPNCHLPLAAPGEIPVPVP